MSSLSNERPLRLLSQNGSAMVGVEEPISITTVYAIDPSSDDDVSEEVENKTSMFMRWAFQS